VSLDLLMLFPWKRRPWHPQQEPKQRRNKPEQQCLSLAFLSVHDSNTDYAVLVLLLLLLLLLLLSLNLHPPFKLPARPFPASCGS